MLYLFYARHIVVILLFVVVALFVRALVALWLLILLPRVTFPMRCTYHALL